MSLRNLRTPAPCVRDLDTRTIAVYAQGASPPNPGLTEKRNGNDWTEFAKGTAIGNRRLWHGEDVTTSKVRLRITKAAACPAISEFTLHREPDWAKFAAE